MAIERFFVHDVKIIRPTFVTDAYQNQVPDWDDYCYIDTRGWLARTGAQEDTSDRDAQITDWILYLAADTDILATDRVVTGGHTYEVDGEPQQAKTPRGTHHLEVALRGVEG